MGQAVSGTVALVPVRSPGEGKTRLATALSREERAALAGAMLADVAGALETSAVDRVVVAAGGAAAAAAASALGLDVVLDPPGCRTLDAALAGAVARTGPHRSLLVVAADLPALTGADVDALLASDAEVTVAPTADGGTGGLLRRPDGAIPTAYGPGSGARHLAAARAAGLTAATVDLAGFRHDVDTWSDLRRLAGGPVGPATTAFLRAIAPRSEAVG